MSFIVVCSTHCVCRQGDKGDLFYILYTGTADISIDGKGSVMKATKGDAFGELALLHGAPRAATVKAECPVTAWALDYVTFKMMCADANIPIPTGKMPITSARDQMCTISARKYEICCC